MSYRVVKSFTEVHFFMLSATALQIKAVLVWRTHSYGNKATQDCTEFLNIGAYVRSIFG